MDIVLNRRGGVPVRDQLVTQLELKILGGELAQGQRLPSVRALARRLKVHHNTVSAAYQDLEAAGHVELQRGSGVFVRGGGPRILTEARGLDEMIRLALPLLAFSVLVINRGKRVITLTAITASLIFLSKEQFKN